jgi:UDP-N-acetylmuramoyl-L-alanyl-D-glutamate--2,6-diaminopimelate ligase
MTIALRLLTDALKRADLLVSAPGNELTLMALTDDSRKVVPGGLYIAIRGTQADGHDFAAAAVKAGAAALVVERPLGLGVPEVVVHDGRRAAIQIARTWYGEPMVALTLVAVTGTNGKTTTSNIVRHLLNDANDAGVIGTIGAFDGAGQPVPSTAGSLTTPGPIDLQATFAALRERGVRSVAMETSSHALDQGRLDGLTFGAGIFTNLTHEHLDYHRTMEHYFASKAMLVGLLGPDGAVIANADDPAWQGLPAVPPARRIDFGLGAEASLRAEGVVTDAGGTSFRLVSRWGTRDVRIPLIGDFNLSNALGAAGAALALGRPLDQVVERLRTAPQVPGRMDVIVGEPFVILRDYMHTPDAYERVLGTLRPLTKGRLIVIFGCGGDRDRTKRPEMGRIAAERADLVVLTTDNPRTEDPDRIIDDVVAGIPGGGGEKVVRILDREEAIHAAVALLHPGDTLLLAGKGHETYQIYGKEKVPFDEPTIVRAAVGRRR